MLLVLFLKCLSWASPATKAKPTFPSKDVLQFLYCLDPTHGYSCPYPWPALTLCGLEWNCCEKTCFRKACQKPFLLPSITAFELRLFTIVLAWTTLQLVWPYILLIWTLTMTCFPGLTLDLLHHYRCVEWSLDCWLNLNTATRPFSLSLFSTAILHPLPMTSLSLPILLSPSASRSPPRVEQIILTVPCNV